MENKNNIVSFNISKKIKKLTFYAKLSSYHESMKFCKKIGIYLCDLAGYNFEELKSVSRAKSNTIKRSIIFTCMNCNLDLPVGGIARTFNKTNAGVIHARTLLFDNLESDDDYISILKEFNRNVDEDFLIKKKYDYGLLKHYKKIHYPEKIKMIEYVAENICRLAGFDIEELKQKSNLPKVVIKRSLIMVSMYCNLELPSTIIAAIFGKNHAQVIYLKKKILERRGIDYELNSAIKDYNQKVGSYLEIKHKNDYNKIRHSKKESRFSNNQINIFVAQIDKRIITQKIEMDSNYRKFICYILKIEYSVPFVDIATFFRIPIGLVKCYVTIVHTASIFNLHGKELY
jgi:hypothetical protein